MQTLNRITWRNGFRLNGEPVPMQAVQKIFDDLVSAKKWEIYEKRKTELRAENLSSAEYQSALFELAYMLGI